MPGAPARRAPPIEDLDLDRLAQPLLRLLGKGKVGKEVVTKIKDPAEIKAKLTGQIAAMAGEEIVVESVDKVMDMVVGGAMDEPPPDLPKE